MSFLYTIIILSYRLLILLASPFSPKAKKWIAGRRRVFEKLEDSFTGRKPVAWFHAASLGEFEQGRPVMEAFREKYPGYEILLTFFSPSGYEIRKNYEGADRVFYLPIDTPRNARRFVRLVRPAVAVFIKYEFWFNYINELHKQHIPIYVISAIFRPEQHFFKPWGSWSRNQLKKITAFFVQNTDSADLLRNAGIQQVTVSGDTRFDRVAKVVEQKKRFPLVDSFARGNKTLLAGSSWPPDEKLVLQWMNVPDEKIRVIIAPHEIHEERIRSIENLFGHLKPVRLSALNSDADLSDKRVLIIDGMGFLSGLYQYCDLAFIGGGFGKGIHNILEAVTFGKPVLFGPNYEKFAEARELIKKGGAFPVDETSFVPMVQKLLSNNDSYIKASETCLQFIHDNTGATKIILEAIEPGFSK